MLQEGLTDRVCTGAWTQSDTQTHVAPTHGLYQPFYPMHHRFFSHIRRYQYYHRTIIVVDWKSFMWCIPIGCGKWILLTLSLGNVVNYSKGRMLLTDLNFQDHLVNSGRKASTNGKPPKNIQWLRSHATNHFTHGLPLVILQIIKYVEFSM